MTTYYPFVQNPEAPFMFQPTMDGLTYSVTIKYNWFAQRWFIDCRTLTNVGVFLLPLIGSPNGVTIESISWNTGTVSVVSATPLGFQIGTTVPLTISGCVPEVLNGIKSALIVDDDRFTFLLTGDPGDATQLGRAVYNINVAAGYFTNSTLVYRVDNATFEVTP